MPVTPDSFSSSSTEPMQMICHKYSINSWKKQRKEPYLLQIITYPQGNRCSPISVARNIPISSVRQPISESVISNALRHPTHMSERWTLLITTVYKPPGLFVICDQLIYNGGYLHEPRRDGSVYKRRVRSAPFFKLKKKTFIR